jgi:hypothetical protein
MAQGVHYKYAAKTPSIPFENAPETIKHARSRLSCATRQVLGDSYTEEFNELLALGYLPGQKINVSGPS